MDSQITEYRVTRVVSQDFMQGKTFMAFKWEKAEYRESYLRDFNTVPNCKPEQISCHTQASGSQTGFD